MVPAPAAYPWSSYRAYAHGQRDSLVSLSPVYLALGATAIERQRRYRQFIEEQPPLPTNWLQRQVLGTQGQLEPLLAQTGLIVHPRPRGRPRKSLLAQTPAVS